jgi:CheY-like chemotaxis protein
MDRARLLLVVDDDPPSAHGLAKLLRSDGFLVDVALNGAAAVGRLSRRPVPDVLITDVRMPYVDGSAVARYALACRPEAQIIFVTAYPAMVDGALGEPAINAVVFTKPLDYECLRGALKERALSRES